MAEAAAAIYNDLLGPQNIVPRGRFEINPSSASGVVLQCHVSNYPAELIAGAISVPHKRLHRLHRLTPVTPVNTGYTGLHRLHRLTPVTPVCTGYTG